MKGDDDDDYHHNNDEGKVMKIDLTPSPIYFWRLKSKLDKHMAEAPDAEFVTEDAVFVYHKKFSVK